MIGVGVFKKVLNKDSLIFLQKGEMLHVGEITWRKLLKLKYRYFNCDFSILALLAFWASWLFFVVGSILCIVGCLFILSPYWPLHSWPSKMSLDSAQCPFEGMILPLVGNQSFNIAILKYFCMIVIMTVSMGLDMTYRLNNSNNWEKLCKALLGKLNR